MSPQQQKDFYYYCVDKDGAECRFNYCPQRLDDEWFFSEKFEDDCCENLESGSIECITGVLLCWDDTPLKF